ncbi:phage tail family protein [Oceanobacillus luteolus]|uniref:distal tail protein Dit n=1 Tax=Oceanobacillus luteolus TaxID=1274358 RepID=UPI00203DD942|nr:distal tail protein Dit [Oceanobacillus luteolus]MCM3739240.1 phage tail family protein [Oceanobacillus luteolus]
MKSLTFNGIKKDWLFLLKGRSKPPFASVRRNLLTTSGMDGAYLQSTNVQPLLINQPVGFIVYDDEHALRLKDELATWLFTDRPAELEFDDEPGRTYFAVVQNTLEDFDKFAEFRQGTIQFLVLDGYGYGPERTRMPITDTATIKNEGTAETEPIIELEVNESITYAMVQNQDDLIQLGEETYPKFMMVGRPHDVEQTPFEKYQRVYYTNANDLVGWTTAANSDIDGGVVAGNIVSRNNRFVADSYGEGSNWHGPAIKTSVPRPIRDFRLSAFVGFLNESQGNMVGRLEIYLLDINGNAVAKMALKDTSANRAAVFAEMRAGDRNSNDMILSGFPNRETGWNNFSGQLRISREWDERMKENAWSAYVALVDTSTGRHHGRRMVSEWRDGGKYSRTVAQIVVHIGTVGNHTPVHANSGVSSIILQEIVKEPEGVPYIAHAGDIITFDSKTEDVFINGEPRNDLLDFGTDFINLVKGDNRLIFHPSSFSRRVVKYREKFR